jgi:hypothetical protein
MEAVTPRTESVGVDVDREAHFKDAVLADISETANVAQFVSFTPGQQPEPRFVRIRGVDPEGLSVEQALEALLAHSVDERVNVRSFRPDEPKSQEFIYGLSSTSEASAAIRRLAAAGYYTIANETIDIHDGGVSGVSFGGVIEFAPDDTPRAVEKPGTAALPTNLALDLLKTVYGFRPSVDADPAERIEFSVHPLRRGYNHEHTIVWERQRYEAVDLSPSPNWPNRFSRFIGDKTYGLLIGDALGLSVPRTTVIARRVAPFVFGRTTRSSERWIRTAPVEQVPGRFTTQHGWTDPFELLRREDPSGDLIAAVLSQDSVDAKYSGAAGLETGGDLVIEGVPGYGDRFMQGIAQPSPLPRNVLADVQSAAARAAEAIRAPRFEWAHDGSRVWILQLHCGALPGRGRDIYPGTPSREHRFDVALGLDELRLLVQRVRGSNDGIVLVGSVGVTSHLGDILRSAKIPSRIEASA